MFYPKNIIPLLLLAILCFACQKDEKTSSDNLKGPLIENVQFDDSGYENVNFYVVDETEVCDLLDQEVIKKWFPEAVNANKGGLGMSQIGSANAGCTYSWMALDEVDRKKVDNYIHLGKYARIEVKCGRNPTNVPGFTQKFLGMKVKRDKKLNEEYPELDNNYYEIKGLGSFAMWNSSTSSLTFAVGENNYFSISIKYPLPEEERLQFAYELGQSLVNTVSS